MSRYVRKESKGLHKESGLVTGITWDCDICQHLVHSTLVGLAFFSTSTSVFCNMQ